MNEHDNRKDTMYQIVIKNLADYLDLPDLRAGGIIIRDYRGWRINEKSIDYTWLINISMSFVGSCWLFAVKFNKSKFRTIENPEELTTGIFTLNDDLIIKDIYHEAIQLEIHDKVRNFDSYDLFDSSLGITLDGIYYDLLMISQNTSVKISVNNPSSNNWKQWERIVWEQGRKLASNSKNRNLKTFFP